MIKGEKTYLRAIEEKDLRTLLEWRNKPHLRKYFREYRELNWDQQIWWYENIVLKDDKVRMFAITDHSDSLLGACGLCYINWIDRNADFSIYLGADDIYIDDVYAIDAAKSLMKYGFEELNLHRLWAEIYEFDEPKTKMFQSLGFKLDGCHRQTHWSDGKWFDSHFYGLLSTD